jgi:hypothetical protein
MNIPDHISESLEIILWVKMLTLFDADPGSGIFLTLSPGSGMEKLGSGINIQESKSKANVLLLKNV